MFEVCLDHVLPPRPCPPCGRAFLLRHSAIIKGRHRMVVTPARQTLKIKYSTPHRKKKAPCHIKAAKMLDAPRRRYYNKRAGFAPAYTPRCCAVGSARGLGPRGRRFESCHLDQQNAVDSLESTAFSFSSTHFSTHLPIFSASCVLNHYTHQAALLSAHP